MVRSGEAAWVVWVVYAVVVVVGDPIVVSGLGMVVEWLAVYAQ